MNFKQHQEKRPATTSLLTKTVKCSHEKLFLENQDILMCCESGTMKTILGEYLDTTAPKICGRGGIKELDPAKGTATLNRTCWFQCKEKFTFT